MLPRHLLFDNSCSRDSCSPDSCSRDTCFSMTVAVATLAFETAALVALAPQTVATTAFIFLQVLIRTSGYQKPIRKLLKIGTDLTLTLTFTSVLTLSSSSSSLSASSMSWEHLSGVQLSCYPFKRQCIV